jgi:hypothetical protein
MMRYWQIWIIFSCTFSSSVALIIMSWLRICS